MANSRKTEKIGIRNFIDIAKEYTLIPKRQRRCKKEDLSIFKGKGISISRTKGER